MTNATPNDPPVSRARRRLEIVLVALFAALLFLPLSHATNGWPPDMSLTGMENRYDRPSVTWKSWFDGTYAAGVDKWLEGSIGLRGFLVHLASQANYSLFGRITQSKGTDILEGRDHWLFERAYVREAVRQPHFPVPDAAAFADRLSLLQKALAQRGIAFYFVISPSKVEVLPELLPADIRLDSPRSKRTAYARIAQQMESHGVPTFDSRTFLQSFKKTEHFAFPPTGVHWSYYSASFVWKELATRLRDQASCRDLPVPAIERVIWHKPMGSDNDLRMLLNLWHFEPDGPAPMPYPVVTAPPDEFRDRYMALIVSDSFGFNLIDAMGRSGAFKQIDLLYYFKRRLTYPSPSFTPAGDRLITDGGIDMGKIDLVHMDWNQVLQNRQVVILMINEMHLHDVGWGFPEALLAGLDKTGPKAKAAGSGQRNTITAASPASRQ